MSSQLKILCISEQWQGANDYAFVRAFRRMGHSVEVVSQSNYFPRWTSWRMRGVRKLLRGPAEIEFNNAIRLAGKLLRPDILFAFKADMLHPESIDVIRKCGSFCVQFYPDVRFVGNVDRCLEHYDKVFSTKPNHVHELKRRGIEATFLPHSFDPETHRPLSLTPTDRERYSADVSFVGNVSAGKCKTISQLVQARPDVHTKIYGPRWDKTSLIHSSQYYGGSILGDEYAKAIGASKINLALLHESEKLAVGDVITARTFEIPASGGFMLHQRTEVALSLFEEDKEAVFFDDLDELLSKIDYYLGNKKSRESIGKAGRVRSLSSGYSVDNRAHTVIEAYKDWRKS